MSDQIETHNTEGEDAAGAAAVADAGVDTATGADTHVDTPAAAVADTPVETGAAASTGEAAGGGTGAAPGTGETAVTAAGSGGTAPGTGGTSTGSTSGSFMGNRGGRPGGERSGRPYSKDRDYRGDRGDEDRKGGRGGKMFFKKKVCRFCTQKLKIDYKDADTLRRFVTDRGKILPRRIMGTCSKHQRAVSEAIKRARILALLPFAAE